MERKIGEIFEHDNEWYQCIEQPEKYNKTACDLCDFHGIRNCELDRCSGTYRSDKKSVIFKKLEKVGGTLDINKKTYQCIKPIYHKGCTGCVFEKSCRHICRGQGIYVEIKTKEDMEENKLNLKPFDLEQAKQGKPVCTRDGRKVRIICFDRRLFYKNVSYPILALVECPDGEDDVCAYNEKGKVLIEDGAECKDDLMMLTEKHEGWVNIYRGGKLDADYIYPTIEEALNNIFQPMRNKYIDTIKLTWEE